MLMPLDIFQRRYINRKEPQEPGGALCPFVQALCLLIIIITTAAPLPHDERPGLGVGDNF